MTAATTALRRLDLTSLPVALRLDAVVTAANGAAYLLAAGPLSDLLGLSAALLRVAGVGLLAFAAVVWLVAAAKRIARPAAATIIALNAVWAIGCIAAVLADLGTPTTAGAAWIVAQALVVAGFAELQVAGLRRAAR
ncbi:MAG TPA: hypothetical protein VGV90_01640 [Solirubrobacteraceae bacterium]|nr:hypothetical protein [Solirubrobacteraceae bacterium]